MKRVLLVVPRLNLGGAETYVAMAARGLKARGYEVFTASGGGKIAADLEKEGIKHSFVPIRLNAALAAWLLARLVRKYSIDIVHANSAAAGIAAVRLKDKFPSLKVVYTAHGVFGYAPKERAIGKADKIIGVSHFVTDYAAERGFAKEKLTTIYNGVDTEKFKPNDDEAHKMSLRQKYNIPKRDFTVALVGRIANLTHKGHEDMLEIMEMAREDKRNWQLIYIGKGKAEARLKLLVKKRGLSDYISFIGQIDDVENVLDMADAIALPSKIETFGLVLAEAMAKEKPVVSYITGGTPEVLGGEDTGFLIEYNNRRAMYEKLAVLADDKELGKKMGKAGRRRVIENFSCKNMLDKIEAVYNEV